MFQSYESNRAGYTTIIANYIPLQDPFGGPNYYQFDENAVYDINIDNVGDAQKHLVYRFKFTNALTNSGKGITLPINGNNVAIPLLAAGPVPPTSNLNVNQTYTVSLFDNSNIAFVDFPSSANQGKPLTDAASSSKTFTKPQDNVGTKTFPNYASYANQYIYNVSIPGCSTQGKVFVGQRAEGFAVNLGKTFDLINYVPIDGSVFPGGITQDPKNNTLANKNVTSIALEVPTSCLKGTGNGVIGGWTTASLPANNDNGVSSGFFKQVSRLGMPLVNEVVIGLKDKDSFNASQPSGDGQFLTYVQQPTLPQLVNALFLSPVNSTLNTSFATLAPTNNPRNDLVAAFLTGFPGLNQQSKVTPSEMLRLNTNIAATPAASQQPLGVLSNDLAGFPNGRRPGDNVVDAELRVAMGVLCYPVTLGNSTTNLGYCSPSQAAVGNAPITDGAPVSAANFQTAFPYLNTPYAGSAY
jgi:hypothetical protein